MAKLGYFSHHDFLDIFKQVYDGLGRMNADLELLEGLCVDNESSPIRFGRSSPPEGEAEEDRTTYY